MLPKRIQAISQVDLTDASPSYIACVAFTVFGFTGSMVPQIKADPEGQSISPNYFNVGYTNLATGVTYAAGTAIATDGMFITEATAAIVSLNVTDAGDGDFNVWVYPREGPAPSTGGALTLSGTAADNTAHSTTKLPTLPARANVAAPTWTETFDVPLSVDLGGNLRVITTSGAGAADNSTNSTFKVPVLDGTATAAAPGYTEGRQVPRSSDLAGNTRVIPAATEAHLGQIGGTTTNIAPTLAVTVAAYSANNCVGGLLTLTSAMRSSGNSGAWAKLTITDHANQKVALDVLLFKSSPAGTFTDKAAFPTMSAADNALVSARVSIATTDWVTMGGSAYCTKIVGPLPVTASGSANLYAAMATTGTPTYAATTDLNAIFGFFCD